MTYNPHTLHNNEVTVEENLRAPNGIPISVEPDENGVSVYVGNIGLDPLDHVTVSVHATGYSNGKVHDYGSVLPVIGASHYFSFPMIKCEMKYTVKVSVLDGGEGGEVISRDAKLVFEEDDLTEWHKGKSKSLVKAVEKHFEKHGSEVNATNIPQYLRKAHEYKLEVQKAAPDFKDYRVSDGTGEIPSKKYKSLIDKRYILVTYDWKIFSFGV